MATTYIKNEYRKTFPTEKIGGGEYRVMPKIEYRVIRDGEFLLITQDGKKPFGVATETRMVAYFVESLHKLLTNNDIDFGYWSKITNGDLDRFYLNYFDENKDREQEFEASITDLYLYYSNNGIKALVDWINEETSLTIKLK